MKFKYTCTLYAWRGTKLAAEKRTALPTNHNTLTKIANLLKAVTDFDHILFFNTNTGHCYYDSRGIEDRPDQEPTTRSAPSV